MKPSNLPFFRLIQLHAIKNKNNKMYDFWSLSFLTDVDAGGGGGGRGHTDGR